MSLKSAAKKIAIPALFVLGGYAAADALFIQSEYNLTHFLSKQGKLEQKLHEIHNAKKLVVKDDREFKDTSYVYFTDIHREISNTQFAVNDADETKSRIYVASHEHATRKNGRVEKVYKVYVGEGWVETVPRFEDRFGAETKEELACAYIGIGNIGRYDKDAGRVSNDKSINSYLRNHAHALDFCNNVLTFKTPKSKRYSISGLDGFLNDAQITYVKNEFVKREFAMDLIITDDIAGIYNRDVGEGISGIDKTKDWKTLIQEQFGKFFVESSICSATVKGERIADFTVLWPKQDTIFSMPYSQLSKTNQDFVKNEYNMYLNSGILSDKIQGKKK